MTCVIERTIARRAKGCSERLPRSNDGTVTVSTNGSLHVTLDLPVRNGSRHVWTERNGLNKEYQKKALAARGSSGCTRPGWQPETSSGSKPSLIIALCDEIWACACLIHVACADFGTVLGRLAEATRTGGRLHASVREGEGEDVSTHGSAAARRRYVQTYWREPALRSALTDAGWIVSDVRRKAP